MMKRSLAAVTALSLLALGACGDDKDENKSDSSAETSQSTSESPASEAPSSEAPAAAGECTYTADGAASKKVDLPPAKPTTKGKVKATFASTIGDIKLTLDADAAPCTVNSMVSLIEQGYYDDTVCHRIGNPGQFGMLQCGDPDASGLGGPGYTIPDEADGTETYPTGTLAMARTMAPNSGGSQFFLVFEDISLDPDYTVFGSIDAESVKAIAKAAADGHDNSVGDGTGKPNTEVKFTKVTVG